MSRPVERSTPKPTQRPAAKPVNQAKPTGSSKPAQHPPQSDGFAKTNAATGLAPIAPRPASPVNPLDAVKLVKNGDLKLSVPIKEGTLPLPGGLVKAKPGTVMTFTGKVKDGKIDHKTLKMSFNPPLDGPLWTDIKGAVIDGGRMRMDIGGLPDPKFGPKLPTKLTDFVAELQGVANDKKVEVQLFGISLGKFGPGNSPAGSSSGAAKSQKPGMSLNDAPIDLGRAHFSLKNVELNEGKLNIGNSGSISVGPGSKFTIEGGLNDVRMKGSANIADLNLDTSGVTVKGSQGSADFDVRYTRGTDGKANVATSITNLNLSSQYAVSRRPNGDYISLADGRISNGSIKLNETVTHGPDGLSVKSVKHGLESLSIKEFDGVLQSAQLTIPDAKGNATVRVGRSEVHGTMSVSKDGVYFDGSVDAQATIEDFQGGKGPASVDVKKATVKGSGNLLVDTKKGDFALTDGNFSVDANLNGAEVNAKVPFIGLPAHAKVGKGSKVSASVTDVDFSFDKGISVGGAKVSADLRNPEAGVGGFKIGTDRIQIGDQGKPAKTVPAKPEVPKLEDRQVEQKEKAAEQKKIADRLAAIRGKPFLERGAKGPAVRELQKFLADAGFKVAQDGSFGPQTEGAVKAYQKAKGLKVDGDVGQQTWGSFFGLKLDPSRKMPPVLVSE